jgi:hypothetical protein
MTFIKPFPEETQCPHCEGYLPHDCVQHTCSKGEAPQIDFFKYNGMIASRYIDLVERNCVFEIPIDQYKSKYIKFKIDSRPDRWDLKRTSEDWFDPPEPLV